MTYYRVRPFTTPVSAMASVTASAATRSDSPFQGLEHQRRRHDSRREQLEPMPGEEREHTPRREEVPRNRIVLQSPSQSRGR
jgi:hypothetical protein